MGFFDIHFEKELKTSKEEVINLLKTKITPFSKESNAPKNSLIFKNFKQDHSLLQYDLKVDINESKKYISLNIYGELLNVWILVIFIVLSILFTYGIGVILIIAYTYYQKKVSVKFLDKIFEELPN